MTRGTRDHDVHRRVAFAAAGILGTAGVVAAAVVDVDREAPTHKPFTGQVAQMSSCPDVDLTSIPAPFAVHDRQLRNLGDHLHGRSITFVSEDHVVVFHVGHDALDEYEDLDFHVLQLLEVGGRRVSILSAGAASEGTPILAAVWDEPDVREPCNEMSAITTSAEIAELIGLIAAIRLDE